MTDKVISFSAGARFYFQLGNYYYYRNNLDKALVYFERAYALNPADASNHFYLARLHSELGNYQQSTSLFKGILKEKGNGFEESWFWLAMNSGQQQQYREASKYLRKYLEQEPDGDYSWQAEEILDYLRTDLPMLGMAQRAEIDELSSRGMELVGLGRLPEAIACFTKASAIEPELTGPRNNLALGWFQLEEVDKAIALTKEVLAAEPQDLFANCNLAAFSFLIGDELTMRRQIQILDGLWNERPDEMLKLGTTYGLLGLDRRALNLFRSLREIYPSYEVTLLLGVATHNCGYRREAVRIFRRANVLEPESPYRVYKDYASKSRKKIPYHLRIPNKSIGAVIEGTAGPKERLAVTKPCLWPQIQWILRHGSSWSRRKLCAALSAEGQPGAIDRLRAEIWQSGISNWQRDIYTALLEKDITPWQPQFTPKDLSRGAAAVLAETLAVLATRESGYFAQALAYNCWTGYWQKQRPSIRNIRLWTAALLVFVQGLENVEALAAEFQLSPRNLALAAKKLTICI